MMLRVKISILYIVLSFIILFFFGFFFYLEVRHVINETIRDNLNIMKDTISEYVKNNPELDFSKNEESKNILVDKWFVIKKNNKIILVSQVAKNNPLNIENNEATQKYKKNIFRISKKETDIGGSTFLIISAENINERTNELKIILISLIFSFMIFFIIIGIAGYIFSGYLLKPINVITKRINYISSDNLSERITTFKQKDEIGILTLSINNLIERLEDSFLLQKNFISNVSHELKTPLSILRLSIDSVLNYENLPNAYQEKLSSSLEVIYSMNFLIKKLLLLARLDEVKNPLQIETFDISEMLKKLHNTFSVIALDKGLKIIFQAENIPIQINADKELLYIALFNILENALKYTEKGNITIYLNDEKEFISILIKDTGIGIPSNQIEKIFDRFYRIDTNKKTEGHGIGLSITKKIIELHKGKIDVKSKTGTGTEFTLILKKLIIRNST